jgi:glycosyltransferase involved in cell wall biosynthesis
LVTPSSWLAGEVKKSSLLNRFPVSVIPYGLDTDVFKPRDKQSSRRRFGLASEAKVVLFVADYLDEKRKGLTFLMAAARDVIKAVPNAFFVAV